MPGSNDAVARFPDGKFKGHKFRYPDGNVYYHKFSLLDDEIELLGVRCHECESLEDVGVVLEDSILFEYIDQDDLERVTVVVPRQSPRPPSATATLALMERLLGENSA